MEERRLLAAGALDLTFGGDGIVTTPIELRASVNDLAILLDGRLVAAGSADKAGFPDRKDFALARYLPTGALDPTFGGDGIVTTDFKRNFDHINAVVVQADGKIIAGGTTDLDVKDDLVSNLAFALARYNVDGSLDTSLGGRKASGKIVLDLSSQTDAVVDLVLQADGKILAVGGSSYNIALVRYHSNGTLDTSFGVNGVRILDLGGFESAQNVVLQPDGKIVISGLTDRGGSFDFMLARFDSRGVLDSTFGTAGIVTTDIVSGGISLDDKAYNLALQADGKLVLAGDSGDQLVLGRYNPDGSPDATFGLGGLVFTGMGAGDPSMAIDASGRIVAVGSAWSPDSSGGWDLDISVARYLPSGDLDSTFGSNGVTTTDVSGTDDRANAVALDGAGRIVAAGIGGASYNPAGYFALIRYEGGSSSGLQAAPAAGGPAPANAPLAPLTQVQLQLLLVEAAARWAAAGEDASNLDNVVVQIADLPGQYLGMASGNTLWLDSDAAGWGWFVDPTPGDDLEFVLPGNQGEQNRMDLLTVVMHELGHLLGHDHDAHGVMAESLTAGVRRTGLAHDDARLAEHVFAGADDYLADAWLAAWAWEQFESTNARAKRRA